MFEFRGCMGDERLVEDSVRVSTVSGADMGGGAARNE